LPFALQSDNAGRDESNHDLPPGSEMMPDVTPPERAVGELDHLVRDPFCHLVDRVIGLLLQLFLDPTARAAGAMLRGAVRRREDLRTDVELPANQGCVPTKRFLGSQVQPPFLAVNYSTYALPQKTSVEISLGSEAS